MKLIDATRLQLTEMTERLPESEKEAFVSIYGEVDKLDSSTLFRILGQYKKIIEKISLDSLK